MRNERYSNIDTRITNIIKSQIYNLHINYKEMFHVKHYISNSI